MRTHLTRCVAFAFVFAPAVLGSNTTLSAAGAADSTRKAVRSYANGSGPVALFRFGRQADRKRDVFAVVDPALWRIQFFTLADDDGRPFSVRFEKAGDCALPPTFRLWRVHQHEGRVVLQSQPEVPVKALVHDGRPAPLTFKALELPAGAQAVDRAARGTFTAEDRRPATNCIADDLSKLRDFKATDASSIVTGGGKNPFRVVRARTTPTLAAFGNKPIGLSVKGRYLVSAQELEDGVFQATPVRHFLVTTRTSIPGFVSTEVVLIRKSRNEQRNARMRINLGLSRVKMGHRSIAIATSGEVLIMGTSDKKQFYVHSCQFGPARAADARCAVTDDESPPSEQDGATAFSDGGQGTSTVPTPPAAALRLQAFNYTNQVYKVDLTNRSDDCVGLAKCKVGNAFPWSPISELRLAEGEALRRGVPYAQSRHATARPKFDSNPRRPEVIAMPLVKVDGPRPFVFGDIENDGKSVSGAIDIFGIDCSAFLSHLWQLGGVLDTRAFIEHARRDQDGIVRRLSEIKEAKIGDAFVINISHVVDDKDQLLLNHIVAYQEPRPSGPTDSSRAILVVESSSSCGGACWSFYDESFFHGWGIIRHAKSNGHNSQMKEIPTKVDKWKELFVQF